MNKKRLVILFALLTAAILVFLYVMYGEKLLPIKLDADRIEEIEIYYDKPIIIKEPRPYKKMHEFVEYIESRKIDFDGDSFENIPVYRYEDMTFVTDNGCRIVVGRDSGYYKGFSGEIYNPAFRIFAVCPTDAIREESEGENVYAVYDTDIGMRMYLFFSKEKNEYLRIDGFPIIMSKVLEYKDFSDINIGDKSSEVDSIDPVTSIYTQIWDEGPDDILNMFIKEGAGPTSIHLLKDGILKIEYKRIEPGDYEITDIEYNEDFTLTGFDGDTCYKISELDYPPEVYGRASITLSRENNADEIAEIARMFNTSVKHENQKTGTTHPTNVNIKYKNGKEITFWCGVGNFITVAKGKGQYNYVNGELDEYIAEIIAGETPIEPVNLTVAQGINIVQPYKSLLYATTYCEGEWLCADGMGAYFLLQEKADVLPAVSYDDKMELVVTGAGKVSGISVFDSDLERTHHRIDEAEFFELCKNLDEGTYYAAVIVSYKGRYIKKEEEYESFADEYIFRMDVKGN